MLATGCGRSAPRPLGALDEARCGRDRVFSDPAHSLGVMGSGGSTGRDGSRGLMSAGRVLRRGGFFDLNGETPGDRCVALRVVEIAVQAADLLVGDVDVGGERRPFGGVRVAGRAPMARGRGGGVPPSTSLWERSMAGGAAVGRPGAEPAPGVVSRRRSASLPTGGGPRCRRPWSRAASDGSPCARRLRR